MESVQEAPRLPKNEPCTEFLEELLDGTTALLKEATSESHDSVHSWRDKASSQYSEENRPQGIENMAATQDILRTIFCPLRAQTLEHFTTLVENLLNISYPRSVSMAVRKYDYIVFLKRFCNISPSKYNSLELLRSILGQTSDPTSFKLATSKIFNIIFFRQIPAKISYYELSLLYCLRHSHFETDKYLESLVDRTAYCFVLELSQRFVTQSRYVIRPDSLNQFTEKLLKTINAFNGLVNASGIQQDNIDKVIFAMLIFTIDSRLIFCKKFGSPELLYSCVRAFHSGTGFAKQLEHFLRTKLYWRFDCDRTGYTIDKPFQTIFKYEFKKYIGSVTPCSKARDASIRLANYPRSSASKEPTSPIKTHIVDITPKMNKKRAVSAFSPFSQRIGEAAGIRDNLDSKRRLDFTKTDDQQN